ncbi:MAG: FG-GAP repeat protein [Planctomycetes bacterium]|nr:FG-GAP repeat protein [Planctomycetota bacterium]
MSASLRAYIVASCTLAGALNAQTLVRSVNGPAAGSQFGKACITIPDQNGDGFKDLLVGAPEFNGGRGAIYCVSGAYLATGSGTQTLWSLAPAVAAGDNFGFALTDVGDVTGDGVHDFLVGQPGYDLISGSTQHNDVGAARLVHGSAHTIVSLIHGHSFGRLGQSLVACGDLNMNGFGDVAIAAPAYDLAYGIVRIVDGFFLTQSVDITTVNMAWFFGANPSEGLGRSVASGADLTGDGVAEIVAGAPGVTAGGAVGAGQVVIYDVVADQSYTVSSFVPFEALGWSVSVGDDYDGDGVRDIVAGAPRFENGTGFDVGRAAIFSSARVIAQTPPYEIRSMVYGSAAPPANHSDPKPNFNFGAAVQACADLDGDGVGEILIGAPGYFTQSFFPTPGWNFRGLGRIYSGASGALLTSVTGRSTDRLGDALAGSIGDLNGDGFAEFVVAGSLSDAGGTDSGVVKCYRLFPLQPATFCVGKVNSLGCTPIVAFSGLPSASSGAPFLITANDVINQKNGLMFYGRSPASTPFQGGTKCVADPVQRTASQNSGGAASGADCTGSFVFDLNAFVASGVDPSLVAGVKLYAQYWSRDPASPSTTSLSNAVQFVINP